MLTNDLEEKKIDKILKDLNEFKNNISINFFADRY
ncbi:MAG: hypothetical protein KatS3mg068_2148 [Candidatus Sericytochromatia bacterium]|nr:MAG: hypothetical protein KatS3mg068_2148 [Candidatus Sericytochromatia bacterium]